MATLLKGKNNVLNFLLRTNAGKFISCLEAANMVFDNFDYFVTHMPDEAWKSDFYNKRLVIISHALPVSVYIAIGKEGQTNLIHNKEIARKAFQTWFIKAYPDFVFARVENFGPYVNKYHGTFYIFDKEDET